MLPSIVANRGRVAVLTLLCLFRTPMAWASDSQEQPLLSEVTVTGTREEQLLSETPASIDVISEQTIHDLHPTHPSELMGMVPGVWINKAGGEGHMTMIRQPLSTSPVYLYLEDGIPTRSTGFFNHNALYEVNLPMAGGVEVNKGPGTALYGSDAIGGVVNVLTRTPPEHQEVEASGEVGAYGWKRLLLTGGNTIDANGVRGDLNLTHTDGWMDNSGFDRQSGGLRWDRSIGTDAVLKTVATFSNISQESSGTINILKEDLENNPTRNYAPITYRDVQAFRLSTAFEKESGPSLWSVTPYYRHDNMDILPSWQLSYDQTAYETFNDSVGLMLKYRQDFLPLRSRLIVGVDVDHSPGGRLENAILTTIAPGTSGDSKVYSDYVEGERIYDYDVTYQGVSPYLHGEISPMERLRVTAGVRYDTIRYDYDNHLGNTAMTVASTIGRKVYGHVDDTTVDYGHLSPKLGATYAITDTLSGFVTYNHAFRAPSEGQLFRPSATNCSADLTSSTACGVGQDAKAQATADAAMHLKPVKVDSFEVGLRKKTGTGLDYEISLYHMTKNDDVVSYTDPVDSVRKSLNAGQTIHKGIEGGFAFSVTDDWHLDSALSYAKHTYDDWAVNGTTNYDGKEMEVAPRFIGNTSLRYAPDSGKKGRLQMEWVTLGSYWLDPANTKKYAGHDLFNVRGSYPVTTDIDLFASITNLLDKRYAETGQLSFGGNELYAPGLPRMAYLGMTAKW
ncbi:MAG: TonB-dependent receptor [Magnetococcus sp. DMHC-6]